MSVEVETLTADDVDRADAICRLAFGTFLGLPDPSKMFGDAELVRCRWRAPNTRILAAKEDGTLLGSCVITRWGSLGWFGPMTVDPAFWDRGVAKELMVHTEAVFEEWGVTHKGLFTFPQSPKHIGLYQRFGYWPRYLTPILSRPLPSGARPAPARYLLRPFSELEERDRDEARRQLRELTGGLLPGLDLTGEVDSLASQGIGETLLLYEGSRVGGFTLCHAGPGSEAGSASVYVKFATVVPGTEGPERLTALLNGIESFARERGAASVEAGVNASHRETYRSLVRRGYRSDFVGVAMQAPDEDGYHRPDLLVIDDWR